MQSIPPFFLPQKSHENIVLLFLDLRNLVKEKKNKQFMCASTLFNYNIVKEDFWSC